MIKNKIKKVENYKSVKLKKGGFIITNDTNSILENLYHSLMKDKTIQFKLLSLQIINHMIYIGVSVSNEYFYPIGYMYILKDSNKNTIHYKQKTNILKVNNDIKKIVENYNLNLKKEYIDFHLRDNYITLIEILTHNYKVKMVEYINNDKSYKIMYKTKNFMYLADMNNHLTILKDIYILKEIHLDIEAIYEKIKNNNFCEVRLTETKELELNSHHKSKTIIISKDGFITSKLSSHKIEFLLHLILNNFKDIHLNIKIIE